MDNNLPDDMQGRGTHLPWNQQEEVECPTRNCNGTMNFNGNDLQCDTCDHVKLLFLGEE